ncbi:hypothetical protein CDG81_00275 [Actinopolyspora erythraea]|uniref:Uncharacterized protein n=1 Tax=Actinopolyspora erythraea TaxID=414996 RepID=A0A223RMA2_9ACTN|nr:hypothetical protein [Actinopolyspora erythraea]ASU77023.1 hypothetical protein CDG81_00275 [Actinopolyspora erythraea]
MTAASTLGPAVLVQPLGLLLVQPPGPLIALGTALALALAGTLAPLRGGHGEHADAGPGALTVAHLLTQHTPTPNRPAHHTTTGNTVDGAASTTPRPHPPASGRPWFPPPGSLLERATIVLHGPDRSPDSDWWHTLGHRPDPNPTPAEKLALLNHPDYQPPTASRQRPRHPTSLTEDDLARLLSLPEPREHAPEPGYIGKHRLVTA